MKDKLESKFLFECQSLFIVLVENVQTGSFLTIFVKFTYISFHSFTLNIGTEFSDHTY